VIKLTRKGNAHRHIVRSANAFHAAKQKELLLKYKNDYESRYKQTASTFGGHAYDALIILVNAIEKAGVVDSEKVRDALENLTSVVGTGGVFSFSAKDHNGLSADSFAMLTVKEREFAVLVD